MKKGLLLCMLMTAQFTCADNARLTANELQTAYQIRQGCGYRDTIGNPVITIDDLNPDEANIPNYAAMFTKGLPHDPVSGLLTPVGITSYQQLLKAMNTGNQSDYNAIVLGGTRGLVSPQSGFTFSLQGKDCSLFLALQPWSITSPVAAAEMLELYWMAICRDVLFSDYGTGSGTDADGLGGSLTNDAAAVLSSLGSAFKGPRNMSGFVDATVLFRGNYAGALVGPYISQFYYQSMHRAQLSQEPVLQLFPIAGPREFGVAWVDYIAIQNGTVPHPYIPSDFGASRYISVGRDISTAVHNDAPNEECVNLANILQFNGFPLSSALPYYNGSMPKEAAFADMSLPELYGTMGAGITEALKAAWSNKWRSYRVLRPEEFGGLVDQVKTTSTNPYGIDASMFAVHAGLDTLQVTYNRNSLQSVYYPSENVQTYLLPQVFPEGSPVHPSYPQGHGTVAGACATIIKAYFENDVLISAHMTPMIPNPANLTQLIPLADGTQNLLTVAGEIDKLACDVAAGRNFAGIHYRQDADNGILLGEQVGIAWLQDQARLYSEELFTGFVLRTFSGQKIRVSASGVTALS